MNRRAWGRMAAVLAVAMFALPGCMKAKDKITLQADGSGTATFTVQVDMAKVEELMAMFEGMGGGESGGSAEVAKEIDIAERVKALDSIEGIEVVSHKVLNDEATRVMGGEITVKFKTLEHLARSGMFMNFGMELKKNEDGSYKLTVNRTPEQMEQMDPNDEQARAMVEGMMAMVAPYIQGMEIVGELSVPGTVVETDGEQAAITGGNLTVWKMGPDDLMDMAKHNRSITFKGEGLTLAPFKVEGSVGEETMKKARKALEDAGLAPEEAGEAPAVPGPSDEGGKPKEPVEPVEPEKEPAGAGAGGDK